MTKSEDALACFRNGITCSSAVFSSFSEELGLDPETAKKFPAVLVQESQRPAISAGRCPVRSW